MEERTFDLDLEKSRRRGNWMTRSENEEKIPKDHFIPSEGRI